ncbi:uncharacterized protein METZ01_LOCUS508654, partial [marine metagenome]
AIELKAGGDLTIAPGVLLSANGGNGRTDGYQSQHGGGGSGGAIRLVAKNIYNKGLIQATGGNRSAGGGRVVLASTQTIDRGVISVGSGSIAEVRPPIVSGPTTVYMSYRGPGTIEIEKKAKTKPNNLLGHWHFDNGTANDSSGNEFHGVASATSIYSVDTWDGQGMSANLGGNNFVIVSDGSTESTFDGGSAFSVTTWVKGWPNGSWEPFISKRGEGGQGWQLRRRSNSAD